MRVVVITYSYIQRIIWQSTMSFERLPPELRKEVQDVFLKVPPDFQYQNEKWVEAFSGNFQCKKAPHWLKKSFHFGIENGEGESIIQLRFPWKCLQSVTVWMPKTYTSGFQESWMAWPLSNCPGLQSLERGESRLTNVEFVTKVTSDTRVKYIWVWVKFWEITAKNYLWNLPNSCKSFHKTTGVSLYLSR